MIPASAVPLLLSMLCTVLAVPVAARAADMAVDLELVLAVDVSRSMDHDEQRLQRDGYVAAFHHPEVIAAIAAGRHGRIAVAYLEWAGTGLDRLVVPWTVVDGAASAAAFARRLDQAPIQPMRRTSISHGLRAAAALFEGNGIAGVRRIIDISGDGPNNQGEPVVAVRDEIVARNITINGLPILLKAGTPSAWFDIRDLDAYYEECVIGGFGAFLIPVIREEEFAAAVRRKLILEIAGGAPRLILAQHTAPADRGPVDCLVGERQWEGWMGGRW